jgi:hypothetical protein
MRSTGDIAASGCWTAKKTCAPHLDPLGAILLATVFPDDIISFDLSLRLSAIWGSRDMWWVVSIVLIALIFLIVGTRQVGKLYCNNNDAFRNKLLMRYCGKTDDAEVDHRSEVGNVDRLIAYLERMVDRELNKARGILPFNSLIMTIMSIEINRLKFNWNDVQLLHIQFLWMAYIVIVLLAISSLLCLNLFLIHWGEPGDYSFSGEVRGTIQVLKRRAIVLEIAVWISIASLFIGVIVVSMGETI